MLRDSQNLSFLKKTLIEKEAVQMIFQNLSFLKKALIEKEAVQMIFQSLKFLWMVLKREVIFSIPILKNLICRMVEAILPHQGNEKA